MPEAIVIGAGHNGLVCAAYLARAGMDVLVLERNAWVGGACITQELVPGFHFSTFSYGAHGPGPKICADLEIPIDAFNVQQSGPPRTVQLFPDGDRVVLWRDPEQTEEEIARFGSDEVKGWRDYEDFARRALTICSDFLLNGPPDPIELRRKWSAPKYAAVLDALLTVSHWDIICEHLNNPKLRMVLARADDSGPCNRIGCALADFVLDASSGIGVQNKAGMLEGGMGDITRVLAQRVQAYGGKIRVEAPVRRVQVEGGCACGVELESGEIIESSLVVSNADPKRTFLKLVDPENISPDFRRSVEDIKTCASYMKFLAAMNDFPRFTALRDDERDDPKFTQSARIFPSLDYMETSWLESQRGEFPQHLLMSLQMPTAYWPDQAPPGKHIFGAWIRWAPSRFVDGSSWDDHREKVSDRCIEIVDSYAPNFSSCIEWSTLYTPADIERETGITDASIRHVDMTLDQMLHRRPLPRWSHYQSPVGGLWMCGSGTHPGGEVTGGPGHNSAAAILQEQGILDRL